MNVEIPKASKALKQVLDLGARRETMWNFSLSTAVHITCEIDLLINCC